MYGCVEDGIYGWSAGLMGSGLCGELSATDKWCGVGCEVRERVCGYGHAAQHA